MAKKYKCPYCNKRYERPKLISHIDRKHPELIPENYTATRVVFNYINKKDHGVCRVCGKETPWNEKAGKYDVLCGNPACKEKMRENYKKNMLRVRGTFNMLNDPEQQKKMLANRSISGKYTFQDKGVLTYTGSYERKCLEFMDIVMQIPSKDIMAPGPTLEYEYQGKKHFYITDFYYIPYNLIIEVKDGGSNPNNKHSVGMDSSRDKTIQKEKLITDSGQYNYIRLTDNNFAQLLEVFMDIKQKLIEGEDSVTIKINESDVILENFFQDEENYEYRLDDFLSGKEKVLFVTGYSGSGKSTLSRKLAKETGAELVSLDMIWYVYRYSDKELKDSLPLLYKYFTTEGKKYRNTGIDNNGIYDVMKWCINNYSGQIIFEGAQLYWMIEHSNTNMEFIADHSVIILGTSYTKSTIRSGIRDKKNPITILRHYIAFRDDPKELKALKLMISKDESLITDSGGAVLENFFRDEENYEYRLNDFLSGKERILYITGYSGSGNSTLARKLAKETGAELVSLDIISEVHDYDDRKLKTFYPLLYKYFTTDGAKYRNTGCNYDEICDAINWCIDNYPGQLIFEGAQFYWMLYDEKDPSFILDHSVIILGTSFTKSTIRSGRRDKKSILKIIKKYIILRGDPSKLNIVKNMLPTNESLITDSDNDVMLERYFANDDDIYYNKDKFDSGEINLCFITGHSGSGKSTMGTSMSRTNQYVEHVDLDDVIANWNYSMDELKKHGGMLYLFFKLQGKNYKYSSFEDFCGSPKWKNKFFDEYGFGIIREFVYFAMAYARLRKDIKFVVEGVWLYKFIGPAELRDYAVYIKGTSALISRIRAAKRDFEDAPMIKKISLFAKQFTINKLVGYSIDEQQIMAYRKYFKTQQKLMTTNEACKDVATARKLVQQVQDISKKYDANFFFVTDGASGYSNGNGKVDPAVKYTRDAMHQWEADNGYNPDDDWSGDPSDMANYKK